MTPDNPLISLLGLGQPQQQPLPPMGPVGQQPMQAQPQAPQAQAPSDPTGELTKISEGARQQMAEQIQRMRAISDQIQQRVQQQSALQVPPSGPSNPFLRILSATAPGQAISRAWYGPEQQQYKAKSGALAQQIQELQGVQRGEEEPMTAISGSIWHPYAAQGSIMRGQAAMKNAETQAIWEKHRTAIETFRNQVMADLGAGKLTQEAARTKIMDKMTQERVAGMLEAVNLTTDKDEQVENVRALEQQFATQSTHWFEGLTNMGPQAPLSPAGGSAAPPRNAAPSATPSHATHKFVPGQGLLPTSK